ncbi:hypothetical protein BDQ17DRAFT_1432347 [Cyathus striatus]|nr:hypothetical protein BDQ17DRAFT_1432347 [Cyathus striatus]
MPHSEPPIDSDDSDVRNLISAVSTIGEHEDDPLLRALISKAHWVPCCLGPFFDVHAALYTGLPLDEDQEISAEDKNAFKSITNLHPQFRSAISGFAGDEVLFSRFAKLLNDHCNCAQGEDIHMVKQAIQHWIPSDPVTHPVTPALMGSRKESHGWYHLQTARALVPLKHVEVFDQNPQDFCNRVLNGTHRVGAHEYPTFLYPDGMVYDAEEVENGLFHGHIFIRTLCGIYTSESSALDGYHTTSKNLQAEIHGMTSVFPQAIGYAATQAHFALSSHSSWNEIG